MLKKSLFSVGLATVFVLGLFCNMAAADTACNNVSITGIGTTTSTPSGLFVKVKNETGAACGAFANGAVEQFFIAEEGANQTYATLLTAYSLGKQLYIYVGGDASKNSLLMITAIK